MSDMFVPGNNPPVGYQQLPCDTVQSLTVPANARWAILKAEAQIVRFRDDGTNPAAAVGMPLLTTDPPLVYAGSLRALRVIAATAGGILNIAYYA